LSEYLTLHTKIWDVLNISGTMRDRKLEFYTQLNGPSTFFGYENFSAMGHAGGTPRPSVNLGPLS